MSQIVSILSKILAGGVTGYITNNLAVKMIFKKYGPFGGVVLKTKDEFISSIAELVESDLINHETLEDEFADPKFKKQIVNLVDDFLNKYLLDNLGEKRLGQIPGIEKSKALLVDYLLENGEETFSALFTPVWEEVAVDELILEKQCQHILTQLYNQLLMLISDDFIEDNMYNIYQEIADYKLAELLDDQIIEQVENELFDFFNLTINDLAEFKISNYLSLEEFIDKIKELLLSDKFNYQNLLNEIWVEIKTSLDDSPYKLSYLLNGQEQKLLSDDLVEWLPQLVDESYIYLNDIQSEIEVELDEIILEELQSGSGLQRMVKGKIEEIYQSKKEAGWTVTEVLLDQLYQKYPPNSFANKRVNVLLKQILETPIGEVVKEFPEKLNCKTDILIDHFANNEFDNFSEKIDALVIYILKILVQDKESISKLIRILKDKKIKSYLTEEQFAELAPVLRDLIVRTLTEKKSEIVNHLNGQIYRKLSGVKLIDLFEQIEHLDINQELNSIIINKIKNYNFSSSNQPLYQYLIEFTADKDFPAKLTDFLLDLFYENLPEMLEGKIANTVAANLNKLSEQEVQATVEEFMGKELQPITYFGALLGMLAGLLFAIFGGVDLNYLGSFLLYGMVGWLTNVIAIWMVFQPYEKKNLLGVDIPLTPGLVAKNKANFAKSLAKFIDKKLLTAGSIAENFKNNRAKLEKNILADINKNNFKLLDRILQNNTNFAADRTADILLEFPEKNAEQLVAILNKQSSHIMQDKLPELIDDLTIKGKQEVFLSFLPDEIEIDLNGLIQKNTNNIKKFLNKIIKLISKDLEVNNLEITQKYFNGFVQVYSEKKLNSFLNEEDLINLIRKEFIGNFKINPANLIKDNSDSLAEYSFEAGWKVLIENKEIIKKNARRQIFALIEKEKENQKTGILSGILFDGAIALAGVDQMVDRIIDRFFKEKLPILLNRHQSKLQDIIIKQIKEGLLRKEELGFINQSWQPGENLLDIIEEPILNYYQTLKFVNLFDLFFQDESGMNNFSRQTLAPLVENIARQINNNANLISEQFVVYSKEKIASNNFKPGVNISDRQVADLVKKIIKKGLSEEVLSQFKDNFVRLIRGKREQFNVNIFSEQILMGSLENIFNSTRKDKLKQKWVANLDQEYERLFTNMFRELPPELHLYVSELLLRSGFDSLENNIVSIFNSVKIKEIAVAEVEAMQAEEIEILFNSFAGKYFKRLKQYGWFGGGFGLLAELLRSYF